MHNDIVGDRILNYISTLITFLSKPAAVAAAVISVNRKPKLRYIGIRLYCDDIISFILTPSSIMKPL